jgi:hypothetical protein
MLHNIDVLVFGMVPVCYDAGCPHGRSCANHATAGEFRYEGGLTPDLRQVVPGSWRCSQQPTETKLGAALIDGSHINDKE